MSKEYKIAMLGGKDTVRGYIALGVDTFELEDEAAAGEILQQVYSGEKYAALFITEDWADRLSKVLNELPSQALPAIVAVPSHQGTTGAGLRNLSKIVEQAVGSDILKIGG